jgi:hypothetical protein
MEPILVVDTQNLNRMKANPCVGQTQKACKTNSYKHKQKNEELPDEMRTQARELSANNTCVFIDTQAPTVARSTAAVRDLCMRRNRTYQSCVVTG